jgi:L-amino acid N-acyltransferase YncA
VELRLATVPDAASVQAIYAPYVENTAVSFEIEVPSVAEMAGRIADVLPEHPWLVAEHDGVMTGYAYAHPLGTRAAFRWSVETTVYVREDWRGRGVGSALYAALLELLRHQGYHRALAAIALPNSASVGLHERFGYRANGVQPRVGWKHGAWHDLGWWQVDLVPGADDPLEPVRLDELALPVLERSLRVATGGPPEN